MGWWQSPIIIIWCWVMEDWCWGNAQVNYGANRAILLPAEMFVSELIPKLAYLSFHNQHKYCPVVNSTTVDYSAFWCNCNCGRQSLHAYSGAPISQPNQNDVLQNSSNGRYFCATERILIRKVNFTPNSYSSSQNAPFGEGNTFPRPI